VAKQVHIALVDDHRIFLDGLNRLVADLAGEIAASNFENPTELLRDLDSGQCFHLIICDLAMKSMNGLALIETVRSRNHQVPILVLSGISSDQPIKEVRRLGANGFVHKSAGPETLEAAISALLAGDTYFVFDTSQTGVDVTNLDTDDDPTAFPGSLPQLAPRQLDVLEQMMAGATNKEISRVLNISENTVKTYLKQIFRALGVNTRTACVQKAQMLGLI